MTIAEEKQAQRTAGRAARKALDAPQRAAANAVLCRRVLELDAYRTAHTLLLYAAFGGEADLAAVAAEAARQGKTVAYPVCGEGFSLTAAVPGADGWAMGQYGIRTPVLERSALLQPEQLDLVLVPCTAFDEGLLRPLPALLHPGGEDRHCIGGSARPPRRRGRPRPAAGRLCNREGYLHMEMNDLSCAQFLAQLASKAPTPGGGGTAALVGAAGVALGNMVGCLTTGKKKYAVVEADIQALNARAEALRLELEALVQADADAFTPLAAAYGLPKDTPEQAAHKASVLEAALDGASAVPLQIMEKCAEGIALAGQYAAKGSVLAVSDAGCAAVLCKAALQAASLNVFINTKLMADRSRAAALDARADALLAEFVPRADETFTAVSGKLRNK